MHEIDDDGLVELVRGTVVQAERDARKGDTEAGDFLAWIRGEAEKQQARFADIDRRIGALTDGHVATPATPAPAQPAPSPFADLTAERLDALGVSQAWAGKTAADMAELQRQQAHRDRASALGVDYRYLPMED